MDNYFDRLNRINVSEHVEKKGDYAYLSWPFAVAQLRMADPTATWEVRRFDQLPYLKTETGYFVEVAVTVQGITLSQIHPVLDGKNRPLAEPSCFDVNTSIQRALVKGDRAPRLGALHLCRRRFAARRRSAEDSAREAHHHPAATALSSTPPQGSKLGRNASHVLLRYRPDRRPSDDRVRPSAQSTAEGRMSTIVRLVQGSAEWHEHRRTHRNASETPVVLGVSPWLTPYQLFQHKLGITQPELNRAMLHGQALEPAARAAYEARTGLVMQPLVLVDGDYSASLDGLTLGGERLLEIKCPFKGRESTLWQAVADGALPKHYQWQVQHQLMVASAQVADVFVFDGNEGLLLEFTPEPDAWPSIRSA